jgi:hypothetical protein
MRKITRDNLKKIKDIRNAFAHSPRPITFRTPAVARTCSELSYHFFTDPGGDPPLPVEEARNPRQRFLDAAKLLILHLHAVGFPGSEYAKGMGEMR